MLKKIGFNKVIIGFILFNVVLTGVTGFTFLTTNKKSVKAISVAGTWGIEQLKQKSSILKSIALVHSNVLPTIAETDAEVRMIRIEVINGYADEVQKSLTACGESCQDIVAEFKSYNEIWKDINDNFVEKGNTSGAINLVLEKLNPIIESTFDKLDKKVTETEKTSSLRLQDAINSSDRMGQILNILVFVFCIITFTIGTVFQKAVSKTLKSITDSLTLTIQTTREISDKINQGISKLSQSTTRQAAAVHQTSKTAEHLTAIVDDNQKNAVQSQESSEQTTHAVGQGQSGMKQLNNVMEFFNTNNNEIVGTLEKVNNEFGKIVTIIDEIETKTKVINEIVFQTRLLSFNASVEAARAGESGKGFAVVAEEVGNLAHNSGKAALEITSMLENSKKIVTEIVGANKTSFNHIIQQGQSSIKEGNKTADLCNDAFSEILHNSQKVSQRVTSVAESSKRQADGLSEVLRTMHDLDVSTQENNSTTEEFAVSATELQTQSDDLQELANELHSVINGNRNIKSTKNKKSSSQEDDHLKSAA